VANLRRDPGKLPSDTKRNPIHQASSSQGSKNASVNPVSTLRSGKVYDNKVIPPPPMVDGVVEDVGESKESDDEPEPVIPKKLKTSNFSRVK
jgi:hypothetical protein